MKTQTNLAWVIDDNEIDQRLYKRVIMNSGLVEKVVCFTYADEALEHLKAHHNLTVDLIFLDINIPRMSGLEFLEAATRELHDDFAKVVVAMLTTSLNDADRERAERFAVVKQFINKPLGDEHVRDVIAHVHVPKM